METSYFVCCLFCLSPSFPLASSVSQSLFEKTGLAEGFNEECSSISVALYPASLVALSRWYFCCLWVQTEPRDIVAPHQHHHILLHFSPLLLVLIPPQFNHFSSLFLFTHVFQLRWWILKSNPHYCAIYMMPCSFPDQSTESYHSSQADALGLN